MFKTLVFLILFFSVSAANATMPRLDEMPNLRTDSNCWSWAEEQIKRDDDIPVMWGFRDDGSSEPEIAVRRLADYCVGKPVPDIIGFGSSAGFDKAYCERHPTHKICISGQSIAEDFVARGFRTPSLNIHCQFSEGRDGEDDELQCDMKEISGRIPPFPRDCDLDWGKAFLISTNAPTGARICHGDTVLDDRLPILPYGQVWLHSNFTCKVVEAGLTCLNRGGHGFSLSRRAQTLF